MCRIISQKKKMRCRPSCAPPALLSAKFSDDGSSVEGGGVQGNGSVPSRGGDTAGAPMPTAKKSLTEAPGSRE